MNINELIILLKEHEKKYGDSTIKVRSHQTGATYDVDYVSYWTKTKEFHIGIEESTIKNIERIAKD